MFCHCDFIVNWDEETRADQVWFRSSCFGVRELGAVGCGEWEWDPTALGFYPRHSRLACSLLKYAAFATYSFPFKVVPSHVVISTVT